MFKTSVPDQIKIRLAFIRITLNTEGVPSYQLILIVLASMGLNLLLWPFIISMCINLIFGTKLDCWTPEVFFGIWGLLLSFERFTSSE
jgi:hypothetical protein